MKGEKRSLFYFKAIYVGEEFHEEEGSDVLVADDLQETGYVLLFKNGLEVGNMHDDDIASYENLKRPVDCWSEYESNQQTKH